jgi:anti-anti-sigma factor
VEVQGRQATDDANRDAYVIALGGEIDVATVPTLDRALDMAVAADARQVVVDCAAVTFLDSSGLRSLVRASRSLAACGGVLTCTQLSAPARRAMEVSGLLCLLTRTNPEAPF